MRNAEGRRGETIDDRRTIGGREGITSYELRVANAKTQKHGKKETTGRGKAGTPARGDDGSFRARERVRHATRQPGRRIESRPIFRGPQTYPNGQAGISASISPINRMVPRSASVIFRYVWMSS